MGDILMVDDQEWTMESLRLRLLDAGAEPAYTSSVEEALDLLASARFSALITDFDMDTFTGKQLIELIKGYVCPYNAPAREHMKSLLPSHDLCRSYACEDDLCAWLQTNYPDPKQYAAFVERHKDMPIVLYSSMRYGDGNLDDALAGVFVAQKHRVASMRRREEQAIIEYLAEYGIFS